MYHLYLYVNQCPKCNSSRTGMLIYGNVIQPQVINRFLKHGQLIEYTNSNIHNCFCADCNARWKDKIHLELLTEQEFQEELIYRGIKEAKKNAESLFKKSLHINTKNAKEKKKEHKRLKRR